MLGSGVDSVEKEGKVMLMQTLVTAVDDQNGYQEKH